MLNFVPRDERGAALETAADVAAGAGFTAGAGLTANRAARVPFGLGAALASAGTVGRPRPVSGAHSAYQLLPWAAFGAGQRCVAAQPQAAEAYGLPQQPETSNKSIKQYPQTTRIAAGNSDAKGPHPARDPV
jgi:hypothetical protein